uniref:Receptivity factor PRFA2 n=1 Tax=Plethodon aureolus TaxID=263669 RepID=Q6RG67_9SALA|nr:receptivity factor PRFA2 [Plethodon aureolus]AAX22001.1 receptivity factor PRFA5 [Plethodon aureolus]
MRSTSLLTFLVVSLSTATSLAMAEINDVADLSSDTIVLFSEVQKFAEDIQSSADSLLPTYLSFQGAPLSDPDYQLPHIKVVNLPTAAMDYDTFIRQTDETRLKNNLYFYSAIVEFLKEAMTEQEDLNPAELTLKAKFEEAMANSNTLISKISDIMTQMGMSVTITLPKPLVVPFKGSAYFSKKLRGGVVCKEYKERVFLTKRDFVLLAQKYQGPL